MRDKQIIVLVSLREREAAKLAASALGYHSLADMVRECLEHQVARARNQASYFEQALQDRLAGEQSDE